MKGTILLFVVLLFIACLSLANVKSSAIGQRRIMGVAESNVKSVVGQIRSRRSDETDSGSFSESSQSSESVSSEDEEDVADRRRYS